MVKASQYKTNAFEETSREINMQEHKSILIREYESILKQKIPTKVLFNQCDSKVEKVCIINECFDIDFEMQQFLKYRSGIVFEFERIIYPINCYNHDIPIEPIGSHVIPGIPGNQSNVQSNVKQTKKSKKQGFEEVQWKLGLVEYAKLIKGEMELILLDKIPTKVTFDEEGVVKRCIVNELLNAGYETQKYIMYVYNVLNGWDTSGFSKIIHPLNTYKLEELLMDLPELMFLSIFADVKHKI